MRHLLIACISLCLPTVAYGWSTKEHVQLTRIAAAELLAAADTPPEMKAWLAQVAPGVLDMDGEREYLLNARMGIFPHGVDGLAFWAVVPDLEALIDKSNKKIPPVNVPERQMHFMDVEYFGPNPPPKESKAKPKGAGKELLNEEGAEKEPASEAAPAAADKEVDDNKERTRATLLPGPHRKPKLDDVKRDPADPRLASSGALPYRVAHSYDELVKAIRDGRLADKPGQFPRDDHAARWAGYAAHYVQDNTQPHHSTWDYKSRAFFPEGTRAPDVHAAVEYKPVDDDLNDYPELRAAYWPLFTAALKEANDLATSSDPWTASVQTSLISYDAIPFIGEAAVAAWDKAGEPETPKDDGRLDLVKFYNHRGQVYGREMSMLELKAFQQAWAVRRTQSIWLAAWKEAKGTPATAPVEPPPRYIGP
jgi:hypothetical protein